LSLFEFGFTNQILWYVVTHFDLKFLDFFVLDGMRLDFVLLLIVTLQILFLQVTLEDNFLGLLHDGLHLTILKNMSQSK
jgi:hypothetical protein